MRINRSTSLMLSAAVALAVAAPAAAQRDEGESPQDIKSQEKTEEFVLTCADDDETPDTVTAPFDDRMWPPNHKYQNFTITALGDAGDGDNDTVTLTTTVTHDEYVTEFVPDGTNEEPTEEVGAGNTRNDASPFFAMGVEGADMDEAADPENGVANFHEVRSERSGRGDGRTYTVTVDADFSDSEEECSGEFEVLVPHDMRSSKADPKEDKTDSTGPNQG